MDTDEDHGGGHAMKNPFGWLKRRRLKRAEMAAEADLLERQVGRLERSVERLDLWYGEFWYRLRELEYKGPRQRLLFWTEDPHVLDPKADLLFDPGPGSFHFVAVGDVQKPRFQYVLEPSEPFYLAQLEMLRDLAKDGYQGIRFGGES